MNSYLKSALDKAKKFHSKNFGEFLSDAVIDEGYILDLKPDVWASVTNIRKEVYVALSDAIFHYFNIDKSKVDVDSGFEVKVDATRRPYVLNSISSYKVAIEKILYYNSEYGEEFCLLRTADIVAWYFLVRTVDLINYNCGFSDEHPSIYGQILGELENSYKDITSRDLTLEEAYDHWTCTYEGLENINGFDHREDLYKSCILLLNSVEKIRYLEHMRPSSTNL